ncbi:hypothetical protein GIB67_041738, partial [Kingdonia uniflora]
VLNTIVRRMTHNNHFDNLQSSGDDSKTVDTGNNSSSNASSKKKIRLARGFQVRMHLPIIYESFKDDPNDRIALVVKELEECYDISHVAWFDLKENIKDAWKREDWVKFADYCNSEKFLAKIKRKKENWAKLIASCSLGRTSMPITHHKLVRYTYVYVYTFCTLFF